MKPGGTTWVFGATGAAVSGWYVAYSHQTAMKAASSAAVDVRTRPHRM